MVQKQALSRDDFAYRLQIPTRWMDNDIYGHVNNALYYAFFDTVINRFLIENAGLDIHTGEVIGLAVESQCQFWQSIAFPDVIDACLRIARIGNSSVRYEVGLFKQDAADCAAFGYFVHVFVQRQTRRPTPIPEPMRAAMRGIVFNT